MLVSDTALKRWCYCVSNIITFWNLQNVAKFVKIIFKVVNSIPILLAQQHRRLTTQHGVDRYMFVRDNQQETDNYRLPSTLHSDVGRELSPPTPVIIFRVTSILCSDINYLNHLLRQVNRPRPRAHFRKGLRPAARVIHLANNRN